MTSLAERYPTEKCKCSRCNRGIYTHATKSPHGALCPFCVFDDLVASGESERQRHTADMAALYDAQAPAYPPENTPTNGSEEEESGDLDWEEIGIVMHHDPDYVSPPSLFDEDGSYLGDTDEYTRDDFEEPA